MRWNREEAILKMKKMGCRFRVTHLHEGNSSANQRSGKPYVTIARLINQEGCIISRGVARCSKRDNPSRSLGRTIATDRALYSLMARATA